MNSVPKSLRLQIGIFGRTNAGKSSFLNMVAGQDVAIISELPGTTTDVVEKCMELLPVGPVVLLDTAGFGDESKLGGLRTEKAKKIFDRADIGVVVLESNVWTRVEEEIFWQLKMRNTPVLAVINKIDKALPTAHFVETVKEAAGKFMLCSSTDKEDRDEYVDELKKHILKLTPDKYFDDARLLGDLLKPRSLAVLIVPIDIEAPKGRIILPQVQAVRDCLDSSAGCLVLKESEYAYFLANMKIKPDIVVCDSQVVDRMVKETPGDIACTTFSILLARLKGGLGGSIKSVFEVQNLADQDRVLIAESCSHHPLEDDIGRVKIPKWLEEYTKKNLRFESCAGRDYLENLSEFKMIIHCGSCMITRKEMYFRMEKAAVSGVPLVNYGVMISYLKGTLERVISPFRDELNLYYIESAKHRESGVNKAARK